MHEANGDLQMEYRADNDESVLLDRDFDSEFFEGELLQYAVND